MFYTFNYSLANLIVSILMLIVTGLGFVLAIIELKNKTKDDKSDKLIELINEFKNDEGIVRAYYKIEYGDNWYTGNNFHKTEQEKDFDKLFTWANYICYLKESKELNNNQFDCVKYYIDRIINNDSFKQYIDFLERVEHNPLSSFKYLINYLHNKTTIGL